MADVDVEAEEQAEIYESNAIAEPRYISRKGLRQLKQRISGIRKASKALAMDRSDTAVQERQRWQAELHRLNEKLRLVIPVDLPDTVPDRVQFGVTVRLVDEFDGSHVITLVGEDEVDKSRGRISWLSPLGRALSYREVGDLVTWQRGLASVDVEIVAIEL